MAAAGISLADLGDQHGIEIADVGKQALVELAPRLERNLAGEMGREVGGDDIVAGVPGEDTSLNHVVRVEHVVSDGVPGFGFELLDRLRAEIGFPREQADFAGKRRGGVEGEERRAENE